MSVSGVAHMRVLIVEPDLAGHHAPYLAHMIEALAELGVQPTVVVPTDAYDRVEYRIHLHSVRDRADFQCVVDAPTRGSAQAAYSKNAAIRRAIRRFEPDHLLVPYIDGVTQVATLLGATGLPTIPRGLFCEGLLFRGGFAYGGLSARARLQHAVSRRLLSLSPWSVVHFLDPLPFDDVCSRDERLATRARLMPDPVDPAPHVSRAEARHALELDEDGRYIVLAGGIDRRKGADLLLHAFLRARLSSDDRLLLAGTLATEIKAMLTGEFEPLIAARRIVLLDRYLPQEQLLLAIVAADLVCVPYPDHIGSASILIRAAAAQRPVLSSDFGWAGHVTSRFDLGWTCNVRQSGELAHSLGSALDRAASWHRGEAGQRFAEFHSVANFRAHWTSALRTRLGLPEHPDIRSWKWVTEDQ
jgi:glycosyltransferase involved in cell wall biosynthesis